MISVFKIQCILYDLIKFFLKILKSVFSLKKLMESLSVYTELKSNKKSDTLLILSGYITDDWKALNGQFDIFTNSSGVDFLKDLGPQNHILHYFSAHHPPISEDEYRSRVQKVKKNENPAVIISSFVGRDIFEIPATYRFLPVWPFLKPYNGPSFLLWLGYKMGYKRIYLLGMRGTQMVGARMASSGVKEYYNTSIIYLALSTARMLMEFHSLFDLIQKKGTEIIQLDKNSWIQPKIKDRAVFELDDSWKRREDQ